MKTLKTILATLLLVSVLASCTKKELKPYVVTGDVTYQVKSQDSTSKLSEKHIRYGYDNFIKDTIVKGDFEVVLKVPASSNSSDMRNIFLSCETQTPELFKVRINQTLENLNNLMKFDFSNSGSCVNTYREIKNRTVIDGE